MKFSAAGRDSSAGPKGAAGRRDGDAHSDAVGQPPSRDGHRAPAGLAPPRVKQHGGPTGRQLRSRRLRPAQSPAAFQIRCRETQL